MGTAGTPDEIEAMAAEIEALKEQIGRLSERLAPFRKEGASARYGPPFEPQELLREQARESKPVQGKKGAFTCAGLVTDVNDEGFRAWGVVEHLDALLACSPARVSRFLSPFASEQRVAMMKALFPNEMGIQDLERATGLTTGQIYHHIKELLLMEFVQTGGRNTYSLTHKGWMALFALLVLASSLGQVTAEEAEAQMAKPEKDGTAQ